MNIYGQPYLLKESTLRAIAANMQMLVQSGNAFKPGDLVAENLENKHCRILENVGIINISGALCTEASFLSWLEGATPYGAIRYMLEEFKKNNDVQAIILDIHSPGGDVFGCSETAEYIRAFPKPVYTYVGGEAASAAYWLATSSKNIIAHKSAFVGSVGAMAAMESPDEDDIILTSSLSPNKVPDLLSDEGKAKVIRHLDHVTNLFADDIALARHTDRANVLATYGQGDIVNADEALKLGMIDMIGNFESAFIFVQNEIKGLTSGVNPATGSPTDILSAAKKLKMRGKKNMAKLKAGYVLVDSDAAGELPVVEVSLETIKEQFPDIAEALIMEGKQKQKDESAGMDEAAGSADPENPDEMAAVAEARAGKMSAEALWKVLAQKKVEFKSKNRNSLSDLQRARHTDNLTMPRTGTEGEISAGSQTVGRLKALRGGKP